MSELVSIIIPTYNRAHLVCEAIDSALAQTYPHKEVIVVDDGSTDDTRGIVSRYGNAVRYIYQENRGVSAARNHGFREARGEYVLFLDSDDTLMPDALSNLLSILEGDESIAAAFGDGLFVGPDRRPLGTVSARRASGLEPSFADAVIDIPAALQSFLFRRAVLDKLNGPFDEAMWGYEDWDILMRLAAAGGRLLGTSQVVFHYRLLGANKSSPNSPLFERRRQSFVHNRLKMLAASEFWVLGHNVREEFFRRLFLSTMLMDRDGQELFLNHPEFARLSAKARSAILYDLAVEQMAREAGWLADIGLILKAIRLCPQDLRLYPMLLLDALPVPMRRWLLRTYRRWRTGPPQEDGVMAVLARTGE